MITFVAPWYGPDTAGGAETLARSLVRELHRLGVPVQVWASTERDAFHPGQAHYAAGHRTLDDVPLWRFRPAPYDADGVPPLFAQQPALLPPLAHVTVHERRQLASLLSSDELYAAIQARPDLRFVFLPYPFPTTFWGVWLAGARGWLLPCLHDEPYARYGTFRAMFRRAGGVLANSPVEAALVRRLYSLPPERVHMTGVGIDLAQRGDGARFRAAHGLGNTPLLLYVGRRDASKNLPLLLAYMREYWARRGQPVRLALIGRGPADAPAWLGNTRFADAPLLDLGFCSEQAKHDAYAAADVFVQPSLYESFSIVLMEAWLQGTPALVHAGCAVTADHAARSGGGLAFGDFGSFAAGLDLLLGDAALRARLGARGRAYVQATCAWQDVARRAAQALAPDLVAAPALLEGAR